MIYAVAEYIDVHTEISYINQMHNRYKESTYIMMVILL